MVFIYNLVYCIAVKLSCFQLNEAALDAKDSFGNGSLIADFIVVIKMKILVFLVDGEYYSNSSAVNESQTWTIANESLSFLLAKALWNTLSFNSGSLSNCYHQNQVFVFFCSGNENIIVYACDCSSEILGRAKEFVDATDIGSVKDRFCPFYCDFCTAGFPEWLACNTCQESFQQQQHDCFSGF